VDAGAAEIPVGVAGETVMMATPVRCAIGRRRCGSGCRRDQPWVSPPKAALDWPNPGQLAWFRC